MAGKLSRGRPIQVWALKKELAAGDDFDRLVRSQLGRQPNNFTTLDATEADRIRTEYLIRKLGKSLRAKADDVRMFLGTLARERDILDVLETTNSARFRSDFDAWRRSRTAGTASPSPTPPTAGRRPPVRTDPTSAQTTATTVPVRDAPPSRVGSTRTVTPSAPSPTAPTPSAPPPIRITSKAHEPTVSDDDDASRTGPRARPRSRRIRRDRTMSTLASIGVSTVSAAGAGWCWLALPSAAEWMVTSGAHTIGGMAVWLVLLIALLPAIPADGRGLRHVVTSGVLAMLRGVAVGTIWIVVAPGQGDLWNRAHEFALGVAMGGGIALLRPWDLTGLPARLLVGGLIRRPSLPGSRFVTRRTAANLRRMFGLDPARSADGVPLDRRQCGGLPPEWIMLALEARLNRLERTLGDRDPDVDEAEVAHAALRHEFDELAELELDLCRLSVEDEGEAERLLDLAIDRVAATIEATIRSGCPVTDERRSRRIRHRLDSLWSLGRRVRGEQSDGVRFLAAACRATTPERSTRLLRQCFEGQLDPITGVDRRLAALSLAYLAVKLDESQLLGWAEGLIGRVTTLLDVDAGESDPLTRLAESLKARSLGRQLDLERGNDAPLVGPDRRRIAEEAMHSARVTGDVRLARRLPVDTPVIRATSQMGRLPISPKTKGLRFLPLERVERRGIHGCVPPGSRVLGLVISILVLSVLILLDLRFATFGSPVVRITDPFRPDAMSPDGRTVTASAVDPGSGTLLIATEVGLHQFDPITFRHTTEPIGIDGPAAVIDRLAPIGSGGVLAQVGDGPSGVQYRATNGRWQDLISLPDVEIGTADVLDLVREDRRHLLILTDDRLLRYDESTRRLSAVSIEPVLAGRFLDWTLTGDAIVLLSEVGVDRTLFRLDRAGRGFTSTTLQMPSALGLAESLASMDGAVLVRTDRDALVHFDIDDPRSGWRVVAGGRQFEGRDGEINRISTSPATDGLLIGIRGDRSDELRIRSPGSRHWRSLILPDGVRIGDLDPILAPTGDEALFVDDSRRLWWTHASSDDPLALEPPLALLEDFTVLSTAIRPDGFSLVLDGNGRREIREGSWIEMKEAGRRRFSISPLDVRGDIAAILPHPIEPSAIVVDREGGLVEYDRNRRSMIGDRLRLHDDQDEPIDSVRSIAWSDENLLVVPEIGRALVYPAPAARDPGDAPDTLRPMSEHPVRLTRRPDLDIKAIRDIDGGFEVIDEEGEAWTYDLATGWRHTSGALASAIDAEQMVRLDSGRIAAVCEDGELVWRDDRDWVRTGVRFDPPDGSKDLPCAGGLAGRSTTGALVRLVDIVDGRPRIEVLREPLGVAELRERFHDACALPNIGRLVVAHDGGLARYEIEHAVWTALPVGDRPIVRVESIGDVVFAEANDGELLRVRADDRVDTLLSRCRSWTTTAEAVLAVDDHHQIHRFDGSRSTLVVAGSPDISSTAPRAATCTSDAAWILEKDHVWRVDPVGQAMRLPLPGNADDDDGVTSTVRDVAANGDALHVLIGDRIHGLDTRRGVWMPNVITNCRSLIELPSAVIAERFDEGVIRLDRENRANGLLPGSRMGRRIPVTRQKRFIRDDRGIWVEGEGGVLRWLPHGLGGVVKFDEPGRLYAIDDEVFHLGATEVHRLDDGPEGPNRTLVARNASVTQVVPEKDRLLFVAGDGVHRARHNDADLIAHRFGTQTTIDGDAIDLAVSPDGNTFLLTDRGEIVRYDTTDRSLSKSGTSGIASDRAELHALRDDLLLVAENTRRVLTLIRDGRPLPFTDVRSWTRLGDWIVALSDRGVLRVGGGQGWATPRGSDRPEASAIGIRSRVPLGADRSLALLDDASVVLHQNGVDGVQAVDLDIGKVATLDSLLDGRVIALSSATSRTGPQNPACVIDDTGRPLLDDDIPSGWVVRGAGAPLILSPGRNALLTIDDEVVWRSAKNSLQLDVVTELVGDATGEAAFVKDRDGRVGRVSMGADRFTLIDDLPRQPDAALALDGTGEPVLCSTDRIWRRAGRPELVPASPRTGASTVLPADPGVLWIDRSLRLRLDDAIIRMPPPEPADVLSFDPIRGRRFVAGNTVILADAGSTWIMPPGSRAFSKIDIEVKPGDSLVSSSAWRELLLMRNGLPIQMIRNGKSRRIPSPPSERSAIAIIDTMVDAKLVARLVAVDGTGTILHVLDLDSDQPNWRLGRLDRSLPGDIVSLKFDVLDQTVIAIDGTGRLWRRAGWSRWTELAPRGLVDPTVVARADLRHAGTRARDPFVLVVRDDAGISRATVVTGPGAGVTIEPDGDATRILASEGGGSWTVEVDFATFIEDDDRVIPETVGDADRAGVDAIIRAIRDGVELPDTELSPSGIMPEVDRLSIDPEENQLVVTTSRAPGEVERNTLFDVRGMTWTVRELVEQPAERTGDWHEIGDTQRRVSIRAGDGLLRDRAPAVIDGIDEGIATIVRQDGTRIRVSLPARRRVEGRFRLLPDRNGRIEYRDTEGDAWSTFRRGRDQLATVDVTRLQDSLQQITHGSDGIWMIDGNGDGWWFPNNGPRRRIGKAGDRLLAGFEWDRDAAGKPVLVGITDSGRRMRIDGAELAPWVAPPPPAQPVGRGFVWNDDGTALFDGRPTRLRGRHFEHEIPIALSTSGGRLRATVRVDGREWQRELRITDGMVRLLGPLEDPIEIAPPSGTGVAETPFGRLKVDRASRSIQVETPTVEGGVGIQRNWRISEGPAEVDRVARLAILENGWVHATPTGLLVGHSTGLETSMIVLADAGHGIVEDLRPIPDGGAEALYADGTVWRIARWNAPARKVSREQSTFRNGAPHLPQPSESMGAAALSFVAAEGAGTFATRWLPDRGAFDFEVAADNVRQEAATSRTSDSLLIPTLAGRLEIDTDARPRPADAPDAFEGVRAVRTAGGGRLSLRSADFSGDRSTPALTFEGGSLVVPWDIRDGLLPHRAALGVAPDGRSAAVFSRLGVTGGVDDELGTPTILHKSLFNDFSLRLTGDMTTWIADEGTSDPVHRTPRGEILRGRSDSARREAVQESSLRADGGLILRRRAVGSRRRFEIELRGEDAEWRVPLMLDARGFLLDRRLPSAVDRAGSVHVADGDVLLRIPPGESCLDAMILGRIGPSPSVMVDFESASRQGIFARSADGSIGLVTADRMAPGRTPNPTGRTHRLQPLGRDDEPLPISFTPAKGDGSVRRITWTRSASQPSKVMIERHGAFDHDMYHSLVPLDISDGDGDVITVGEHGLAWRSAGNGRLIDILTDTFEPTPLVTDEFGQWRVRATDGWRALTVDPEWQLIMLSPGTNEPVEIGFESIDWRAVWQGGQPRFLASDGTPVTPHRGSWLPGDDVVACLIDGGTTLLGTDAGLRIHEDETRHREVLGDVVLPISTVRQSAGSALRTGDRWIDLESGAPRVLSKDEHRVVTRGDQLAITLEPEAVPRISTLQRGGDASSIEIPVAWPWKSLPGDHVKTVADIGGRLAAVSPLGMFDAMNPRLPWAGFDLEKPTRRLSSIGLVLDDENTRMLPVEGGGAFRIDETADSVRFTYQSELDLDSVHIPLFEDDRWLLSRSTSGGTAIGARLVDRQRGLAIDSAEAIVEGQLHFDHVLAAGGDLDGPWVLTDVALERLRNGSLVATPWTPAQHRPWESPGSTEVDPAGVPSLSFGELTMRITLDEMLDPSNRRMRSRRSGERVHVLPSGLFMIGPEGELEWIRNPRKWYP